MEFVEIISKDYIWNNVKTMTSDPNQQLTIKSS